MIAISADVADEDAVARLFDHAEQAFGGADVVVNAAGVMLLAPVVAFLASPEGHWINGQTVQVNGGII